MNAMASYGSQPSTVPGAADEQLCCIGCGRHWPRTAMRWGARTVGPLWFPRKVRVLRCPDCLV